MKYLEDLGFCLGQHCKVAVKNCTSYICMPHYILPLIIWSLHSWQQNLWIFTVIVTHFKAGTLFSQFYRRYKKHRILIFVVQQIFPASLSHYNLLISTKCYSYGIETLRNYMREICCTKEESVGMFCLVWIQFIVKGPLLKSEIDEKKCHHTVGRNLPRKLTE